MAAVCGSDAGDARPHHGPPPGREPRGGPLARLSGGPVPRPCGRGAGRGRRPAGRARRLPRRGGVVTTSMVLPLAPVARYRVLFADCDPMRIMYYASYYRLFEIGRAELFRGLGHCFADYVARGLYLAVVSASCRYRRPARYDDDLEIRCGVRALGRARITIAYEIARGDEVVVDGETEHALVDDDGRPQRLPADFRALLVPNG